MHLNTRQQERKMDLQLLGFITKGTEHLISDSPSSTKQLAGFLAASQCMWNWRSFLLFSESVLLLGTFSVSLRCEHLLQQGRGGGHDRKACHVGEKIQLATELVQKHRGLEIRAVRGQAELDVVWKVKQRRLSSWGDSVRKSANTRIKKIKWDIILLKDKNKYPNSKVFCDTVLKYYVQFLIIFKHLPIHTHHRDSLTLIQGKGD